MLVFWLFESCILRYFGHRIFNACSMHYIEHKHTKRVQFVVTSSMGDMYNMLKWSFFFIHFLLKVWNPYTLLYSRICNALYVNFRQLVVRLKKKEKENGKRNVLCGCDDICNHIITLSILLIWLLNLTDTNLTRCTRDTGH